MPGSNANTAHAVTPYSTLRNNFVLLVPVPFARSERSLAPAYGTPHHANCVFFRRSGAPWRWPLLAATDRILFAQRLDRHGARAARAHDDEGSVFAISHGHYLLSKSR